MFSILQRLPPFARQIFCYCFMLVLLTLYQAVTHGQIVTTTTSVTDGRTPSALQPGSPAGTYPLSGFDSVNVFNGNLNFRLPLLQIGGRGSAQMTTNLTLNLKSWHIKHTHKVMPDQSEIDSYVPIQTGWTPYADYGAGRLDGRNYGLQTSNNLTCRWYSKTLSRLTFSASDGTEYELRDQLTNGQPLTSTCTQGAYRGTVFVTADGTAATFVSDTAIYDNPAVNAFGPHGFSVSGFLMLKDGTHYRIDNSSISWIRDRNGNKISFAYASNSMTITDQLNRTITINYNVSDVAPYGLCDKIIYKGFGGTERIIRVSHTNLGSALRPNSGYSIRTLGGASGLFPETNGSSSTYYDPTVTSVVWLPDGRNYKFYYNSYGELARVELPTGGAYEYDMTSGSGVICLNSCWPDDDRQIYRRIRERRVYSNGGSGSSFDRREVYTNTESVASNTATVTVETLDPTGALVARSRHYFDGSALDSLFGGEIAYAYGAWYEGNERQTDLLDTAGEISSAVVLRRTVTTRVQRATVSWWASHAATYGLQIDKEPPNDPRVIETVNTLEPATTNLVSKQTSSYDDTVPFNNPSDVYEYGFGSGAPGSLVRRTHTEYLKVNPLNAIDYTTTNIHIRSLPTQQQVFDAAGSEKSRVTFEYDNYANDGLHGPLTPRSALSGICDGTSQSCPNGPNFTDVGYQTRGNVTKNTSWILSTSTQLSSYLQYDVAGNVVKTIDPRGYATLLELTDRFGTPDGDARSNIAPSELAGQASFAFVTKVTNALGHTGYTQFDYYLGQPVDGEDANGIVASGYFNDALDRPTQIRRAVGTTFISQTTFAYDDVNRVITTTSDLNNNNDNLLVSKVLYDGLGRPKESRQYEGGTNYIATQQQFDALGRIYKTSNAFRPWQGESIVWTTTVFDALGRVTSVTTPDNSVVITAYSGSQVTVTDQIGKKRRSETDALGRLIKVYEDPNGLNHETVYDYDVLDNLVKTTQGIQHRFFMYDSLKRLIRARNPEQGINASLNVTDPLTGNSSWSLAYEYDANSNLTQKTDARGIISTYDYDELNRNKSVDYSDTAINPDVSRFYDGATNGKGSPWYSYAGGNQSAGTNVEKTLIDSYDVLGRPTVLQQSFKLNSVWSSPYQISRSYNLAGNITSQTYPSEHTVAYNYDVAGRLADKDAQNLAFTGTLGDGTPRTYARGISYASSGQLKEEQFGTATPVYNKLFYNSRQQLAEILASTTGGDASWNRGKIVNGYSLQCIGAGCNATDNNGNIRKQEVYIPANDQVSSYTSWYQQYDYDQLNRLKRVREYTGDPAKDWQQEFDYDRWGNRTIHQSNTWGTNIPKPNFGIDSANNNRLTAPSGYSLSYDNAGNLTSDTHGGSMNRLYDAENKMAASQDSSGVWSNYAYNADGQRTRRKINNQETWQIYGFDGELLAEYPVNGAPTSPQKEYGYRNEQLLVMAEPSTAVNVALAANGAVATASSAYDPTVCVSTATSANDGDRTGRARCNNHVWNDAAPANTFPDWLQIDFNGSKTITEIDLITIQDHLEWPVEPTESMNFSLYGLTTFKVQYWHNSTWVTIPGGDVSGNNKVWRKFTFAPLTTTKIQVLATGSPDGYSRIVELEAWTGPSPAPRYDLALGATATASTSYPGWGPSAVVNGDRKSLNAYSDGAWSSSAANNFPEWVEVDLGADKTINEIHIFTLQDNWAGSTEPTEATTFTLYGLTGYEVKYWNGSSWLTVPGGNVTENNKIWRKFTFSPITTRKLRVFTNAAPDGVSRITEIEAYGPAESNGSGGIHWLVTDNIGTPRMVLDQTGSLAFMKRHDYLPFGEELFAQQGLRTGAFGYSSGDGVRQQFTSKERDIETGLDYFLARYYSSIHGRFTAPDEFPGGPDELYTFAEHASENPTFYADLTNPQSLNKYQYSYNNPLRYVDPDGHDSEEPESQKPKPVVPVPVPVPGAPPLPVPMQQPGSGPTDQEIVDSMKKVWEWPDPYLYPISQTIGTAPDPTIPPIPLPPMVTPAPKPQAQPVAPPPPVQARPHRRGRRRSTKDKHEGVRPGQKQPPNYRPFRRPPRKPKPPPKPPKPKPQPKPEIGPDGEPVKPPSS